MAEVEEEVYMRAEDVYLDKERRIRLDKVLLGFELDDTMTEEEHRERDRRARIAEELGGEDSFYADRAEEDRRMA